MAELVHSVQEVGLLQPVVVRAGRRRRSSSWSWASAAGGPPGRPGSTPSRRSSGRPATTPAAGRAAGEPAPGRAQPARGGGRLPAAARRLRLHPRGARLPDRPQPAADQQHHPAAQALPGRCSDGSPPGVLSAGHARALLGVEDAETQDRLAGAGGRRGHLGARRSRRSSPVGDLGEAAPAPRAAQRARPRPAVEDLAARLSDRLETRVKVDLGQRKGRITVEFASLPDLERIVALIDPEHPAGPGSSDSRFVDIATMRPGRRLGAEPGRPVQQYCDEVCTRSTLSGPVAAEPRSAAPARGRRQAGPAVAVEALLGLPAQRGADRLRERAQREPGARGPRRCRGP